MRILLIEDSTDDALLIEEEFDRAGRKADFHLAATRKEVETALDLDMWDLIISDYDLGPFRAPDVLRWVAQRGLDIPFLVVSGVLTEELAVSLLQAGAHDFCMKQNMARLVPAANRELREARFRRERRITEEKLRRAEETLRRNEARLREAEELKAIGILAGGIAHDFNNLMTAVNGFGYMALSRLEEDHPVHGMLTEIVNAGERAAGLTRQIVAFGQKQILAPKSMDLNEEVRQRRPFLSRIAGDGVEIVLDLDPALGMVCMDPKQIGQVLANLISNSREAIPAKGRILIRTEKIDLDGNQTWPYPPGLNGDYAVLSVMDDGVGMEPSIALRVFEPYFTTKKAATRLGLGLGLATVHGIVSQSQGHITVESMKGQGSTFRIFLPFTDQCHCQSPAKDKRRLPVSSPQTILVTDGEKGGRDSARLALEGRGFRIIEAESGRSAIGASRIHGGSIEVILLDIDSFGMPAQEFAAQCSEHFRNSRVVFMSSRAPGEGPGGRPSKCTARFIRKPFTTTSLIRVIEDAMGNGSDTMAHCAATCLR